MCFLLQKKHIVTREISRVYLSTCIGSTAIGLYHAFGSYLEPLLESLSRKGAMPTVNGWNSSPVDMSFIPLHGLIHSGWCRISAISHWNQKCPSSAELLDLGCLTSLEGGELEERGNGTFSPNCGLRRFGHGHYSLLCWWSQSFFVLKFYQRMCDFSY